MANIFWDHYGYVLGWPKSESTSDMEMARKQHESFKKIVKSISEAFSKILILWLFINFSIKIPSMTCSLVLNGRNARKLKAATNFIIEGTNELVCEDEHITSCLSEHFDNEDDDDEGGVALQEKEGICLVTGERSQIARLNPRTPILGTKK